MPLEGVYSSPIIGNETVHVYCVYPPSGSLFATGSLMVAPSVVAADESATVGAVLAYQFIVNEQVAMSP